MKILEKDSEKIIIIDLNEEYSDCNNEVRWAIVTSLDEEKLDDLFNEEIAEFRPYILLSPEQGEAICEFNRNQEKHRWRERHKEIMGLSSDIIDIHSKFDREKQMHMETIEQVEDKVLLSEALNVLTDKQRNRIIQYYYKGKSKDQIAEMEGVVQNSVYCSIESGLEKMRAFFQGKSNDE